MPNPLADVNGPFSKVLMREFPDYGTRLKQELKTMKTQRMLGNRLASRHLFKLMETKLGFRFKKDLKFEDSYLVEENNKLFKVLPMTMKGEVAKFFKENKASTAEDLLAYHGVQLHTMTRKNLEKFQLKLLKQFVDCK